MGRVDRCRRPPSGKCVGAIFPTVYTVVAHWQATDVMFHHTLKLGAIWRGDPGRLPDNMTTSGRDVAGRDGVEEWGKDEVREASNGATIKASGKGTIK